jgi:hypothetical protein
MPLYTIILVDPREKKNNALWAELTLHARFDILIKIWKEY